MPRKLRQTPSTPADLHASQNKLLEKFDVLFDDFQSKRVPLSSHLIDYEDKFKADPVGLRTSIANVLENAGFDNGVIAPHLETIFPKHTNEVVGMFKISPWNFSFKPDSLWRGNPPNHTIRKLARSIIVCGFRADSTIASRTLSLTGAPFSLSLGDGSARAIAAALVWRLIEDAELSSGGDHMQHLVWSLSAISVNFEKHGTGSHKETLVAHVSRQNQEANVQPVSTVQWLTMIRQYLGQAIGSSFKQSSQVQQVLEDMVTHYNKHPEVMAYDVDKAPPSKKKRRSTKNDEAGEESNDQGLKVGRRRVLSMKSFLSGANDLILDELVQHITIVGDYKVCALTDDLLQLKQIYIGSRLGKDQVPSEAQLTALHAAGDAVKTWIEGECCEIKYDVPLSSEQFVLLWRKMIKTYETLIAGMTAPDSKIKERPKADDWISARKVVQLWDTSIEPVASKHLSQEDFKTLESIILESTSLDTELVGILDRMPKYFHMGLIPSLATDDVESVDAKQNRLAKVQNVAELAALDAFQQALQADWDLISSAGRGAASLGELLSWIEIKHRRDQAKVCEDLVDKYMLQAFPAVSVTDWPKAAAQIALIKQANSKSDKSDLMKGIAVIDFNVPAARDVLKMPLMVSATAEMLKVLGVNNSVLLAIMPNAPKEGSKTSAFDDEVTISKLLTKSGFSSQDRIRQFVDMPAHIANKVSQLDWFVDGRLCYLGDSKDNFFFNSSELSRTKIVQERATVTDPDQLIDTVSLEADEGLNTGGYADISAKLAQRGVDVAKAQLNSLLTKSKRCTAEWLTPQTKVVVIDITPFVGDRALASRALREAHLTEFDLVHVIMQIGKGVSFKHAEFSHKRVKQEVAALWFENQIVLSDSAGTTIKVVTTVPEPTPAELKLYPGAELAHAGMRQLDFQVCVTVGSRVQIRPDKLSVFAGSGRDILAQVDALKHKHDSDYASVLDMCFKKESGTQAEILPDNREDPSEDEAELSVLDSIEVIKANFTIEECNSGIKGVKMYRDLDKRVVFLYAKQADVVIKVGDNIGGVGGGTILDCDPAKTSAVPWLLPKGDKTWVQRVTEKGDDAAEDGDKKPKFLSGTLYSILRELERRSTEPLTLTSFGAAFGSAEAGKQTYTFKNEPGSEGFRKIDYVLSPPKPNGKLSHGNFFAAFVSREHGLGSGALQLTWRLTWDPVAHALRPTKVYVTAAMRIMLPKGKPVKVCWAA